MTDEQLNKWNLRFCPKCGSHFHFKVLRSAAGQNQFSMVCFNYPDKCEYLKVLTASNISDIDRHKIIEDFFGYNKPFQRIPPSNSILPADLKRLNFVQKDHEEELGIDFS